jgi:hypothetical protein
MNQDHHTIVERLEEIEHELEEVQHRAEHALEQLFHAEAEPLSELLPQAPDQSQGMHLVGLG